MDPGVLLSNIVVMVLIAYLIFFSAIVQWLDYQGSS